MHRQRNLPMDYPTLSAASPTAFCACAAAKAALIMLLSQKPITSVAVQIPDAATRRFFPENSTLSTGSAGCTVCDKDDRERDALSRLPVTAEVSLRSRKGITLESGTGIGRVIKKGMNLPVSEGAVNYFARKMIECELEAVLDLYYCHKGVNVVLSVPGGDVAAAEGSNETMLFRGGVAIIGCSDMVKRYSISGFKNDLRRKIDDAFTAGCRLPVLAVGPEDHEGCAFNGCEVLPVWNHLGFGLRSAAGVFDTVLVAGHPERLFKVMLGCFNTHTQKSASPLPWLRSQINSTLGNSISGKKTAGSSMVDTVIASIPGDRQYSFFNHVASNLEKRMRGYVRGQCTVGVLLHDRDNNCIGIGDRTRQWKEYGCLG
jgi:cobalt-precorrin-5B (C1)-methyltransferase